MSISDDLKIEAFGPRAPRDEAGVSIEYLGVRVIIAPRCASRRDRGVWVILQDEAGREEMVEVELVAGATQLPDLHPVLVEAPA